MDAYAPGNRGYERSGTAIGPGRLLVAQARRAPSVCSRAKQRRVARAALPLYMQLAGALLRLFPGPLPPFAHAHVTRAPRPAAGLGACIGRARDR